MQAFLSTAVVGLVCWFVGSSLWIYPHSLSYFNESIGGPLNGAEHLLGSNLDWGQDMITLQRFLLSSRDPASVHFDYYGMLDPGDLLDPSLVKRPLNSDATGRIRSRCDKHFYAVSANVYYGYPWIARSFCAGVNQSHENRNERWLPKEPVVMAGYSILIFELARHPHPVSTSQGSGPTSE